MTEKAMQRQLYSVYANENNLIGDILNIISEILEKEYNLTDVRNEDFFYNRTLAIKYIINNLKRPLLEKIYNYTWELENDE